MWIGVAWLHSASPSDEVVLTGAEPVNPSGNLSGLSWFALALSGDGIGVVDASNQLVNELQPLAGTQIPFDADEAADIEVVGRLQPDAPGRVSFTSVRLFFTVNGEVRSQVFPFAVLVCMDDPKPAECA